MVVSKLPPYYTRFHKLIKLCGYMATETKYGIDAITKYIRHHLQTSFQTLITKYNDYIYYDSSNEELVNTVKEYLGRYPSTFKFIPQRPHLTLYSNFYKPNWQRLNFILITLDIPNRYSKSIGLYLKQHRPIISTKPKSIKSNRAHQYNVNDPNLINLINSYYETMTRQSKYKLCN